jgi:aspartate/methionine/tyrosine aminotransferase
MLTPSPRAAAVEPFHVMRILERARALQAAGRDIIHMEVGEPDFPTPEPMREAARTALESAPLGYTPAAGLPELRRAIAGYYGRRYGVELDPLRVIVTPGGSGALQLALAAVVGVGDGVLTSDPGYPCNDLIASLLGGIPRRAALSADDGFAIRAAHMAAHWQPHTRALMVATPSNPTGAVIARDELAALHALTRERDAALIVDEIYQGLTYGEEDCTAVALGDDNVFVVNSFSKYFGMTGWRLGWLVAPTAFADVLSRLAQNLYLAAPTLSQHAALAAFAPRTLTLLDERRDLLRERRDVLLAALRAIGFEVPVHPGGAFYIYARIPRSQDDAASLAQCLLEEAGVAVTPGIDFGRHDAERMLRFAYTTDKARLLQAVERIGAAIGVG